MSKYYLRVYKYTGDVEQDIDLFQKDAVRQEVERSNPPFIYGRLLSVANGYCIKPVDKYHFIEIDPEKIHPMFDDSRVIEKDLVFAASIHAAKPVPFDYDLGGKKVTDIIEMRTLNLLADPDCPNGPKHTSFCAPYMMAQYSDGRHFEMHIQINQAELPDILFVGDDWKGVIEYYVRITNLLEHHRDAILQPPAAPDQPNDLKAS